MIRAWKVYGEERKEQKESFEKSKKLNYGDVAIWVFNSDVTNTTLYTYIKVEADAEEECEEVLENLVKGMEHGRVLEVPANFTSDQGALIEVGRLYKMEDLTDATEGTLQEIMESEVVYIGKDEEGMPMFAEFGVIKRDEEKPWNSKVFVCDLW